MIIYNCEFILRVHCLKLSKKCLWTKYVNDMDSYITIRIEYQSGKTLSVDNIKKSPVRTNLSDLLVDFDN